MRVEVNARYRQSHEMMRKLPRNIRVWDVRDRRHAPSPGDPHNLLGLIDENVEALALQITEASGNRRWSQIVKDEGAVSISVRQTCAGVQQRPEPLVISINNEEAPCFAALDRKSTRLN